MKVSVIATIKNEEKSLHRLLDSLCRQTRLPDEVVMCDGGSTDQTLAILNTYQERLPIKIIVEEGTPDAIFGAPKQARTQAFLKNVL